MSARSTTLGLAAAAACVALAAPLPASAAPAGSPGMDQSAKGALVDVCGRERCANLAAQGPATGYPFKQADARLTVNSTTGVRPAAGQCVKVTVYVSFQQGSDTFRGDGTGKLCATAEGILSVSSRYSGDGIVGDHPWSIGSGSGTVAAIIGNDGTASWRTVGSYSLTPVT